MWYIMRWLCGWASILDGLVVVLSLGFLQPALRLYAECAFLDLSEQRDERRKSL